ncbi:MAG TPA: branched-chain amino acid ABC transporter permease [Rugosimonospora sp.]|nr:branched-chain amino acid ABC transporter permease [Rugosimonospora sp.]
MRRYLVALGVAVALVIAVDLLDPFRDYQLATAAGYLCATAGLTVLVGQSGQLSLGHGALMAIGAYAVALVQNAFGDRTQWMLLVSLAVGVLAAAVAGAVVGVAAARLRGPYLAGLTLVVAVAVPSVGTLAGGVFHGDQGLSVFLPPPPAALGADLPFERWQAGIALSAALVTMLLLANLTAGRFGRTLRAVRDDEVAAALSGIAVGRVRVLAFVVSAACAGLGGGVFAVLSQSVSPDAFALTLSLNLLLAIVVGGLGSLAGAVWGSLLLVLLPWLTDSLSRAVSLPPGPAQRLAGNLPLAIFGLLLIVVMIAAPSGVQGLLNRAGRWARGSWRQRRTPRRAATAAAQDAEPDTPVPSRT